MLEQVRAAVEKLTGERLVGVLTYSPTNASQFHISLDEATAFRLWPEPIGPDPSLACIREPDGWVVHLMDHALQSKAYWTDIPDPTNDSLAGLIPMLLGDRLNAGHIQPTALMYDHVHDVRRTYFETGAGQMIVHSRRVDATTKRTQIVLEVVERQLFFEVFWLDDYINLSAVREIPELPAVAVRQVLKPVPKSAKDAGLFYSYAGIAIYSFPLRRLRECIDKHCETVPSVHAGRVSQQLRQADIDPECLEILLAAAHERTHFVQSMSTPCGALEWRVLRSIISTAGFLLRKITDSHSIARTVYLPLVDWYVAVGSEAVRSNPPFGPDTKSVLKNTGMNRRRYLADLPDRLDQYFQEMSTLVRFWKAMTKREALGMRDFVKLANEAFDALAFNSDLRDYPVWSAHDLELDSYLPEEAITLEEILEGDARLREHQGLAVAGTNPADWSAWRNRFVAGTYAPAYEWLLRELASAEVARTAIEIALTTPLDLTCKDAVKDGVIYVEDCLPGWRLKKIVVVLKQFAWPRERELAERAARRDIADLAGIPSPRRTLFAMQGQRFTGDRAWGTDARLHGIPAGAMDYFEYSRRELLRGLEIRRKDFFAFSRPDTPEIFQPLIEIFTDTALLNIAPSATPLLPLYVKTMLSLIANKIILEIFFGEGRVAELKQIEASFLNRLSEDRITAESIGWPGLPHFAKSVFGTDISKLLNW